MLYYTKPECGAGWNNSIREGTVPSKLLENLGVTEVHKEILVISASEELSNTLHDTLNEAFLFSKRNKGIAFTIPFKRWQKKSSEPETINSSYNIDSSHYCIIVVVDKGRSKECVKSARAAGAKGGTLIHGRGAGIPTNFYFPLVIEPQKDIVMIITTRDKVSTIRERIFPIWSSESRHGILFTLRLQNKWLSENGSGESGRFAMSLLFENQRSYS